MQVRPCDIARRTDIAELLPCGNLLSCGNPQRTVEHVRIQRMHAAAMVNDHIVSVAGMTARDNHSAAARRDNGRARTASAGLYNVNAAVIPPAAER